MITLENLPHVITAIGGLGTASFGLVDSTKVLGGGVNRIGFGRIQDVVQRLTPGAPANGLTRATIVDTLKANWYNGTDLTSQKAIAKSLIKVGLNSGNSAALAAATGVDAAILTEVATCIGTGTALSPAQTDVYARFDFILSAMLDEVYHRSDEAYATGTRVVASIFSLILAILGGWTLHKDPTPYFWSNDLAVAALAGILATPLAPIAKDISSALATAVNAMQSVKK
jgi:hypothetical protein